MGRIIKGASKWKYDVNEGYGKKQGNLRDKPITSRSRKGESERAAGHWMWKWNTEAIHNFLSPRKSEEGGRRGRARGMVEIERKEAFYRSSVEREKQHFRLSSFWEKETGRPSLFLNTCTKARAFMRSRLCSCRTGSDYKL